MSGRGWRLVDRDDKAAVNDGLDRLGLSAASEEILGLLASSHVDVSDVAGHVVVGLLGMAPSAETCRWVMIAGATEVLVIGDLARGSQVHGAVVDLPDPRPSTVLAAAILGVARSLSTAMAQLADQMPDVETPRRGFSRAAERSEIRVLRGRLFVLEQAFTAQAHLLDDDEVLARLLGEDNRRTLGRARSIFEASRGTSARLYALAGDLLTEQSAVINERLTLVSTFFLPMTVATGFFGMNFDWLTDRVGTASAFVGLGVITPVLASLLTLSVVRRLGAG